MKKHLRLVVSNLVVLGILSIGYLLPQYSFFVKTFFTTATILFIILYLNGLFLLNDPIKDKDGAIKRIEKRRKSKLYMIIDIFFDVVFVIMFAFLDYKLLFILWLIQMILSYSIYVAISKKER